jgi:hypothetical protein
LARALSEFFTHVDREQRQTSEHQLGVIRELERQRLVREQLQERRRVRAATTASAGVGSEVTLGGATGVALLRQIVAAQAADNALLAASLSQAAYKSAADNPSEIEE